MGKLLNKIANIACVPNLEDHIKRFPRGYRGRLRNLTRDCGYMADLIVSFPAAIFAIATDFGHAEERSLATRLIKNGQPLRLIADALGLPYWLRKAPPEAFKQDLVRFPRDPDFVRKLVGSFPAKVEAMSNWMYFVPRAAKYGHNDFAIWLAKQKNIFDESNIISGRIYIFSAYAWLSKHPDTYAGSLIQVPWNKDMKYQTLFDHVSQWMNKVRTVLLFGPNGIRDTWLKPGNVGGYQFIPLMTPTELKEEGEAMSHCVGDYTFNVAHNSCRIFSVKRGGKRVATLEIQAHSEHEGIPVIEQLYAHSNEEASQRIWQAAYLWLAKQPKYDLPGYIENPQLDINVWRKLWRPLWEAKGKVPLFPEEPKEDTLSNLGRNLHQ